jgi:hypothetical protein
MTLPYSPLVARMPALDAETLANEVSAEYLQLKGWIVSELASTLSVAALVINITRIELIDQTLAQASAQRQLQVIQAPAKPHRYLQDTKRNIEVEVVFILRQTSSVVVSTDVIELLFAIANDTTTILGGNTAHAGTLAICGNGQCEHGEICKKGGESCSDCQHADCPYVFQKCPSFLPDDTRTDSGTGTVCSGHGRCIGSTGLCSCFSQQGYTGTSCGSCAAGTVKIGSLCGFEAPAATTAPTSAPTHENGLCSEDNTCISFAVSGALVLVIALALHVIHRTTTASTNAVAPAVSTKFSTEAVQKNEDGISCRTSKMDAPPLEAGIGVVQLEHQHQAQSAHWQCFVQPGQKLVEDRAMSEFRQRLDQYQYQEHGYERTKQESQGQKPVFGMNEDHALQQWRRVKFENMHDLQQKITQQLMALQTSNGAQQQLGQSDRLLLAPIPPSARSRDTGADTGVRMRLPHQPNTGKDRPRPYQGAGHGWK